MILQRTLLGAVTAGLISLPFLLSSSTPQSTSEEKTKPERDLSAATRALRPMSLNAPAAQPDEMTPRQSMITGPETSLDEIFRFDITPEWIFGRWPRVSTTTKKSILKGYRIPLVTGTEIDDLAGSLTYYFDPKPRLQRIVFRGATGDTDRLTQWMKKRFGFRRQENANADCRLFQVHWHGKPVSELNLRPAAIVDASQPRRRYEINLLIERPQSLRWFIEHKRRMSEFRL